MNPVCTCACGRRYIAIEWSRLPLAGTQALEWGELLELRTCVCGSTRAVQIEAGNWDESELDPRDPDLAVQAMMRRVA